MKLSERKYAKYKNSSNVFIIKNVVKIKNIKNVKKRDINKKRKKRFLHLCLLLRLKPQQ